MKVGNVGSVGSTRSTEKKSKTQSTGNAKFGSELKRLMDTSSTDGAAAPDSVEGLSPMGGVNQLLTVQSLDSADAAGNDQNQRRKMARRGTDILDHLEEVRRGLLLGAVPKEKLAALAQLVRQKRTTGGDPHLSALLDEIELRAEVELAKLSREL